MMRSLGQKFVLQVSLLFWNGYNKSHKYFCYSFIISPHYRTLQPLLHSKNYPEPKLHQNDTALQHWIYWIKIQPFRQIFFVLFFKFKIAYKIENMVWLYSTFLRILWQKLKQDLEFRKAAQGADYAQGLSTLAGLQRPKAWTQIHCRSRSWGLGAFTPSHVLASQ
jgi:hypothetical protein